MSMATSTPTIRRQLTQMVLFTSGAVLLLAVISMFAYDFITFRQTSQRQLETLGRAIAANSTAALAFDNRDDAQTVLAAFQFDQHITRAALYRLDGTLFAVYPSNAAAGDFPSQQKAGEAGFHFGRAALVGTLPVTEGKRRMGTLYVQSDLRAIYDRIRLYAGIVALVVCAAGLLAYGLSRRLQQRITAPILDLAHTANAISTRHDYSVRASKGGAYELDQLTEAFNHMLGVVEDSEARLHVQLGHLSLLQQITRAISDRQDLASITQVVVTTLERSLPIQFGCAAQFDATTRKLTISTVGAASHSYCKLLALEAGSEVPLDDQALATILEGKLIHEPDTRRTDLPLLQRLAGADLGSVVIAPLVAEKTLFGVLIAARTNTDAFTSPDCEFLKQLSEHVALASHQAELNNALQMAYDDLQRSQHTTMQQERLRALGQIASGIAHDINNAISPVTLYTEYLLERETGLSERSRSYLTTIQRAIEDVADTVSRMREFYREREPQLSLSRIDLNVTVQQALQLTHARWSDLPQQKGVMIEVRTDLAPLPAEVMAAEGELRGALTNLIFNAVDAMPEGGTLTVRTRRVEPQSAEEDARIYLEVSDTGVGMDEATQRRCLEPFFTTKGERGSGLGLAMVYGMIKRHSADMQVESVLSQGSTFRMIFAAAGDTGFKPSFGVATAGPRPLRILLVDDDPLLIGSLQEVLQGDGHDVTAANGGQIGIDTFTAEARSGRSFAVVITDLGMPYVDGRRVAAAVKAVSPQTPVVLLTGWGQRLVSEGDVPPHVDRVLNKPPRLADLRAALADVSGVAGVPKVAAGVTRS
jgi:signal transduction histidine kinase/ActR/RegA family two-component response regulator